MAGISRLIQTKYQINWMAYHFLGFGRLSSFFEQQRQRLRDELLAELGHRSPRTIAVERVDKISKEEFYRNYLTLGKPVIMTNAMKDWPCIGKWTPENFRERYGSDPVTLIDAQAQNVTNINYTPTQSTLGEVLTSLINNDPSAVEKYSRFNTLIHDHPELIDDIDMQWLRKHKNLLSSGNTFQLFIGAKGTKTHLHAASEHNLFCQVYGKKSWKIYPPSYDIVFNPPMLRAPYFISYFDPANPDYEHFPHMRYLDTYTVELEAGDIFFNPPSWWHYVENTENSIGFGYRWFGLIDSFIQDPAQATATVASMNPPMWQVAPIRHNFLKIFEKMKR